MTPTPTDLKKEKQYDADMQHAKDYVNQYFMEEELDKDYFEAGVKRVLNHIGQQKLAF